MINTRETYIDLGAGVMILWMITYHALWMMNVYANNEMQNPCIFFPYLSFFMPWFFYKSGRLFKKRDIKELWEKDSCKLLSTYAIWSAIGYVLYLTIGFLQNTITLRGATYSVIRCCFLTGQIPLNDPLWFLLTLFGVRFMANILLPNRNDKFGWLYITVTIIVGAIGAYLCYRWNHRLLPYWVANSMTGMVFFALGYGLREYENKWWLILPSVAIYIVCCIGGFPIVDMIYNKSFNGNYVLWIPTALCGIIVFNTLCRWVAKGIRMRWVEWTGRNAMVIYVTHAIIVHLCVFAISYFELISLYSYILWIIIGAYMIFLPILCVLIPKVPVLIGQTIQINETITQNINSYSRF